MTGKRRAAGAVWQSNKKGGGDKATAGRKQRPSRRKVSSDAGLRRTAALQAGRARRPSQAGWAHEIKFDGYRLQLRVEDGEATLRTRKGLDWTEKFAAIAKQAAKLPDCMIDGEAVALDAHGAPDFSALQAALSEGQSDKLVFFAFDLLFADGEDLRALPLRDRKARAAGAARRAQGQARGPALCRAFRDGGRRGAGIGLSHAPRRHRLQGARCALSLGPRRQLGQDQVPGRPRGGDRRLDQRGQASCARCWSASIADTARTRSWSMSAASAPASARPSCARWCRGCARSRASKSPFAGRRQPAQGSQHALGAARAGGRDRVRRLDRRRQRASGCLQGACAPTSRPRRSRPRRR